MANAAPYRQKIAVFSNLEPVEMFWLINKNFVKLEIKSCLKCLVIKIEF